MTPFESLTLIVEKKINNKIQSIFLHDSGNNLKNLSSNSSEIQETTIISENGIVEKNKMILFNGQIISAKKNSNNEIIKFEQLNIDLGNLNTMTIKEPKIQETSTFVLLGCLFKKKIESAYCNKEFKKEILTTLNRRRIILPLYIPVIALVSALLLIKSERIYFNRVSVFLYSFTILLFTELAVRLTGKNDFILFSFIIMPFILMSILYFTLNFLFTKESKTQ